MNKTPTLVFRAGCLMAAGLFFSPAYSSTNTADGMCMASGSTLGMARANYSRTCDLPRKDCDLNNGEWTCASHRIVSSPLVVEQDAADNDDVADTNVVNDNEVESACIDTDGDGWGWDGSRSCIVTDVTSTVGDCLDPDGDGWGWDGEKTCLIETATAEQQESPQPDDTTADNDQLVEVIDNDQSQITEDTTSDQMYLPYTGLYSLPFYKTGDGAEKELLIEITDDGRFIRYDYQGDGNLFSTGDNCYIVSRETITSVDEDEFGTFHLSLVKNTEYGTFSRIVNLSPISGFEDYFFFTNNEITNTNTNLITDIDSSSYNECTSPDDSDPIKKISGMLNTSGDLSTVDSTEMIYWEISPFGFATEWRFRGIANYTMANFLSASSRSDEELMELGWSAEIIEVLRDANCFSRDDRRTSNVILSHVADDTFQVKQFNFAGLYQPFDIVTQEVEIGVNFLSDLSDQTIVDCNQLDTLARMEAR